MSCNNLSSMLKTCSESELGADDSETKAAPRLVEGSRLRRTFTLPRNPFGTSKSSGNKVKSDDFESTTNVIISDSAKADGPLDRKLFRRPSWKRFLNKIAQHMNTVSVSGVKHSPVMVNGDRVPISGEPPWPLGATPAATGIKNHGNTCYMNAVLQCLSHTDIIAEYFVLDHYKVDLQKRNKINSKKYGTRGEVTEELAALLKSLWTCQYTPCMSTAFKFAVDRHGPQYRGNSQHDAQEFLFWLLDKVHEDLNTATKKKYKIMKNTCGKPDEVVAAETLANHARRNSSFVQAVFQAQYRSALTCGRCERTSCTFDPFHCISVQLPPRQASAQPSPLPVNVVYVNQQPRQVLIGVELAPTATMDELKQTLHTDTGIELEHIILTEISDAGWSMARAGYEGAGTDCGALYCVEAPPLTHTPTQPYLLVLWINLLDEQRFGSVYAMQVARETCYVDLQKLMLKEMCAVVGARVLESSQPDDIFRARIAEPHRPRDPAYLQPELPHPLYALDVEQALNAHEKYPHLKLELLWNPAHRDSIIRDCGESCEVHVSAAGAGGDGAGPGEGGGVGGEGGTAAAPALTLHACLHHYTRAERLAQEDAWRCPQCQRYMPVVKTLGLWSLPDVLVIHLKRFRQQAKGRSSTKLTTMVEFPLKDFDMTPHIVQRRSSSAESPGNSRSPKRRLSRSAPVHSCPENVYDLYAICYHHGEDLETGHYTAACKNPYDNHWYKFDDSRVSRVESEDECSELINNSAYMLFYRRKKPNVMHTCSLIDGQNGHWALHMPKTKKMTEIAEAKDESEEKCHKADSENDIRTDSSLSHSASTLPDVITPKSAHSLSENNSPVKSANDNSQGRPAIVEINGNDEISDDQISVYENDVSSELYIHKDVHVNPKMTPVDTSREKRPKSVDYPKTNEPSGDVNRNYDSSPLVATINGLEYHPTTEELVLSMFQETKFIMSPLSREAHRPGEKTNAWKTRIST